MRSPSPSDIGRLVDMAFNMSPTDIPLVIERVGAHALAPRMSAEAFEDVLARLGCRTAAEFGERFGIDEGTIAAWSRFGVPRDCARLLLLVCEQRERLRDAVDEFDGYTHVGLADFFRDRGLL